MHVIYVCVLGFLVEGSPAPKKKDEQEREKELKKDKGDDPQVLGKITHYSSLEIKETSAQTDYRNKGLRFIRHIKQ